MYFEQGQGNAETLVRHDTVLQIDQKKGKRCIPVDSFRAEAVGVRRTVNP